MRLERNERGRAGGSEDEGVMEAQCAGTRGQSGVLLQLPWGQWEGPELQKGIFTTALKHQALTSQSRAGSSPCPQPWKTSGPT